MSENRFPNEPAVREPSRRGSTGGAERASGAAYQCAERARQGWQDNRPKDPPMAGAAVRAKLPARGAQPPAKLAGRQQEEPWEGLSSSLRGDCAWGGGRAPTRVVVDVQVQAASAVEHVERGAAAKGHVVVVPDVDGKPAVNFGQEPANGKHGRQTGKSEGQLARKRRPVLVRQSKEPRLPAGAAEGQRPSQRPAQSASDRRRSPGPCSVATQHATQGRSAPARRPGSLQLCRPTSAQAPPGSWPARWRGGPAAARHRRWRRSFA